MRKKELSPLSHLCIYLYQYTHGYLFYSMGNNPLLSVMVNFIGQLPWAKGYPDIWLNIISRCVCESVPRRNPHLNQWTEWSSLPSQMWGDILQSVAGLNRTQSWRREEFTFLPDFLNISLLPWLLHVCMYVLLALFLCRTLSHCHYLPDCSDWAPRDLLQVGSSPEMSPPLFEHFLPFCHLMMFQTHLVFFLPELWNEPFLQRALILFIGEWNLGTEICVLALLTAAGCHGLQTSQWVE